VRTGSLWLLTMRKMLAPLVMKLGSLCAPQVDAHSTSTGRSDLLAKVGIRSSWVLGGSQGAVEMLTNCKAGVHTYEV